MNTALMGRLMWKEYRAQRALWLFMAGLGFVFQVILRIVFPQDAAAIVWGIAGSVAILYMIGSTAILFAGEREDRTSDWLVHLAVEPRWTLLSKLGFAFLSTLALLAALSLNALLIVVANWQRRDLPLLNERPIEYLAGGLVVVLGVFCWSVLGSLTSRRVIVAVPMAMIWWLLMMMVPLALVAFAFGTSTLRLDYRESIETFETILVWTSFLAVLVADVWLGWRWCQGKYVDTQFLDDLNERLHARLRWGGIRVSRFPTVVESELAGWRTWQRLVWQERQRESLHIGALLVVCAVGALLALCSLGDGSSFTFLVIPLIVALPCGMGLLSFRFDEGGQQLRFLANRGTSPTMIWLAKQVVWLPRALWIPAACCVVACFAEWAIIPWSDVEWNQLHSGYSLVRHPLVTTLFNGRQHFGEAVWFALMSYAVGQAAAMLFRRVVLSVGAGLMVTILLVIWQANVVIGLQLPRWWAVGGIAVWLLWLTWWYSRHWLLERRNISVLKRLAAGLILPPMLLLFGVAVYRWLEIPGFGPSSRVLMAILYPREFERRTNLLGGVGHEQLDEIRAAIARASQPTSPDLKAIQTRLAGVNDRGQLLSQIRRSPEFTPNPAVEVNRDELERAVAERFWSVNADSLATLLDVLSQDLPELFSVVKSYERDQSIVAKPELLLDAGRLSLKRGEVNEALQYFVAALRLGRYIANQGSTANWCFGRDQQAEVLQALVAWSNDKGVTRELLLSAITQTRDKLARFPTLQEASVADFVHGEDWLRRAMEQETSPMQRLAIQTAVVLLPQEVARWRRDQEQVLFWQWNFYRALEWPMRTPGASVEYSFRSFERAFSGDDIASRRLWTMVCYPGIQSRFGGDIVDSIVSYEAVNRVALLALAISLWKQDHEGLLPESLEDLMAYCLTKGRTDSDRVLPSLTLNDPWSGKWFGYSAASRKLADPESYNPVVILYSQETGPFGVPHGAVQSVLENGLPSVSRARAFLTSRNGRLWMDLPSPPSR